MADLTTGAAAWRSREAKIMINRAALILRYKEPFIRWVNEVDPVDDDPGITLAMANADSTIYLITEDDAESIEQWLSLNYQTLFESMLEEWYTDEALWPQDRTRSLFDQWFEPELHTVLVDTVGGPIVDEEL